MRLAPWRSFPMLTDSDALTGGLRMRRIRISGYLLLTAILIAVCAKPVSASEPPLYNVKVDTVNQLTYVYQRNENNEYDLMDIWATSSGKPSTPTIQGEFTLRPLKYGGDGEWYLFASWPCWVNYCTQISGNYCFHSPPMNVRGVYEKTPMSSISEMMYAKSHGCVRLLPRQAAFMWHNMAGCRVQTYKGQATDETNVLREQLLKEIPTSAANYPDPIITDYTTYWYTYHGDTIEKVCTLTGRTPEELRALNPSFDFSLPLGPGKAIRIKGAIQLAEESEEEQQPELYAQAADIGSRIIRNLYNLPDTFNVIN